MPAALETFREWELSPPSSVCNVIIIHAGDGSDSERITITDKPYYDKGVSGTKYHHTYPAPIHCIISPISTADRKDEASMGGWELTTEGALPGDFIDLAVTRRFEMYRGDTTWSLTEEEYPFRFTKIAEGRIENVSHTERGTISVQPGPVRYALDRTIGSQDLPKCVGACFNVPFVLVSAPDLHYRMNSSRTGYGSSQYLVVKDNGVVLTEGSDYTIVLEDESFNEDVGGSFLGRIEMSVLPSGKLTADINWSSSASSLPHLFLRLLRQQFYPNYPPLSTSYDPAPTINPVSLLPSPDGTKLYIAGTSPRSVAQFTLSTPWDLSTASYASKWLDFTSQIGISNPNPTPLSIDASSDGTKIYMLASRSESVGVNSHVIYQYSLGTPWELNTGSYASKNLDLSSVGIDGYCGSMIIRGDLVFVVEGRNVYKGVMTGGDIDSVTGFELVKSLETYIGAASAVQCIEFSPDGKKFYWLESDETNQYHQINLLSAFDFSESYLPGRYYFFDPYDVTTISLGPGAMRVGDDGKSLYIVFRYDSPELIYQVSGLEDYDLPVSLVNAPSVQNVFAGDGGVYCRDEVAIGEVLHKLAASMGMSYYVSRKGTVSLFAERDPEDVATPGVQEYQVPIYDLTIADLVGETGRHIRHVETLPPVKKVTAIYQRNYSPLSESESASSLSAAEKAALSRVEFVKTGTNTLSGYETDDEIHLDTYCRNSNSALEAVENKRGFRSIARLVLEIQVKLGWQSMLSQFDIGSIIRVVGNLQHPALNDGDYLMVDSLDIDWSRNIQTLRVFK